MYAGDHLLYSMTWQLNLLCRLSLRDEGDEGRGRRWVGQQHVMATKMDSEAGEDDEYIWSADHARERVCVCGWRSETATDGGQANNENSAIYYSINIYDTHARCCRWMTSGVDGSDRRRRAA